MARCQYMEPLAGAAPARFSYKENLQAAAERQKKWWAATVLPRVLRFKRPLHHSLMLAARKMACRAVARQSEGWSQSRVLPSAELVYETGLSAGSIAVLADGHLGTRPPKLDPPPGVAPSWLAYRASASLTMLWGL
jgi:hypothetical protein